MGKNKDFYVQVPSLTSEHLREMSVHYGVTISRGFTAIFKRDFSDLCKLFKYELPPKSLHKQELEYPEAIIVRMNGKRIELPFPDELRYAYAKAWIVNKKETLHLHLENSVVEHVNEASATLGVSIPKMVVKIIDTYFYAHERNVKGDIK